MLISLTLILGIAIASEPERTVLFSFTEMETIVHVAGEGVEIVSVESELYAVSEAALLPLIGSDDRVPIAFDSKMVAAASFRLVDNGGQSGMTHWYSIPLPTTEGTPTLALQDNSNASLWAERLVVSVTPSGGSSAEEHVAWRHYQIIGNAIEPISQKEWDSIVTPVHVHVEPNGHSYRYYDGVPDHSGVGGTTAQPLSQAELALVPRDQPVAGGPVTDPFPHFSPLPTETGAPVTDDDIE